MLDFDFESGLRWRYGSEERFIMSVCQVEVGEGRSFGSPLLIVFLAIFDCVSLCSVDYVVFRVSGRSISLLWILISSQVVVF